VGPGPREDSAPERGYGCRTNASSLARVPTLGGWVCAAVPTASGLIIGAMALSSWERMWQCHTETPSVPIVYLPTHTVMVSGGATNVSFGPDSKAPGALERADLHRHGAAGDRVLLTPLDDRPATDQPQFHRLWALCRLSCELPNHLM
jgi:hypothetical protein